MPQISVVVPCYNGERFLGEALQSILDQSYQDFELIVVDDGSTDRSSQIVKQFDDPRLRYIYQQNRGPGAARNRGSALAQGRYLAYLDDDDVALAHRLATQVSVLQADPSLSVVGSGYVWVDEQGQRIPWRNHSWQRTPELNSIREWLFDCPFVPSATMLRRSAWEDVGGFDEQLRCADDWNFWMRLVLTGHRMAWHPDIVCLYRWSSGTLSHNAMRMASDSPEALRRVLDRPDFPLHLRGIGRHAMALRHVDGAKRLYTARLWEEGRLALEQALTLNPHLLDGLPSRIEDELVAACLDPLVAAPISVLASMFDHLPANAQPLASHRQRMLTRCHVELLARGFRQRDYGLVWQHSLPVVLRLPRWTYDRGMWAVALRAIRNRRRATVGRPKAPESREDSPRAGEYADAEREDDGTSAHADMPQGGRTGLVQVAGAAIAEMGVIEPSAQLLEPIARTIHDLIPPDRKKQATGRPRCSPN